MDLLIERGAELTLLTSPRLRRSMGANDAPTGEPVFGKLIIIIII